MALVAVACTPAPSAGGATVRHTAYVTGGTLTELIASDPGNLDPLTTVTGITRTLDGLAYDPLVNLEPDGNVVSGLATSWKQSGTTYTFTLRHGMTCSDGSTMSPATVAANINFLGNPANRSPLITLFVPAGAKAVANTASSRVTITLLKPFPFFLEDLTGVRLVCAKGLARPSTLAEGTDGSGPYVLTRAVAGEQYTFTIRRGYTWGPAGASTSAAGMPAKVVVKVVSDPTTAADLLLDGGANVASVQGLASKPLRAAHLFNRSAALPLGELWFNQGSGHATADVAVREAIVRALDLPEVGKVFSQDQGSAPTGLVTVAPKACPGNTVTGTIPSTNSRGAAALLQKAGWKLGKNGKNAVRTKDGKALELTLLYPTTVGGDPASAFELAAQELTQVGVGVKLVGDTVTELESVIFGTGSWDVVDVPIGIDTPNEAVPFLSGPAPPDGENFAHISNPTYTSLATKAAALPGTSACPDWNSAEKQLFKALDVVPFENAKEPVWGKGATFDFLAWGIPPTSLRLVKG
ncbi:MAG: ABC transporter substrate-binding protein, partial [Acidimicrobiales bacterium]